jgi:hypothetical protein
VSSVQSAYAVLSSVACLAPQYFFYGMIFEKEEILEHKMCVLIFSATSGPFNILRRNARDIKNVYRPLCKVPVDFN